MTVNFETMDWLHNREMVFRYEDEDAFRYEYEEPEYTIRSMLVAVLLWKNKSISQKLKGVPTLLLVCRF